jgi:hypothetical protein
LAKPSRSAGDHRLNRRGRQVVGRALEAALDTRDPLGKIGRYEGHLMRQLVRTLELLRQAGLTNADRSGANKLPAQT